MAVNITWTVSDEATSNVDYGDLDSSSDSGVIDVSISHDGEASITACGLFLAPVVIDYNGAATPEADHTEMITAGDDSTGGIFHKLVDDWVAFSSTVDAGNEIDNPVILADIPSGDTLTFSTKVQIPVTTMTLGARQVDLKLTFAYTS